MANPFFYKKQMDTTYMTPATSPTQWTDQGSNSLDLALKAAGEPLFSYGNAASEYKPFFTFDGSDDYGEKDSATILPTTYPFCLEAWVRTTSTTEMRFISLVDKDVANVQFSIGISTLSDGKFVITARNTSFVEGSSSAAYNDGEWHHVVGVYASATDRKLYVDGAQDGSETTSVTAPTVFDRISVGRFGDSTPSSYFDGDIMLGRLWNRELSSSDITTLYNGGDVYGSDVPAADQWGSAADLVTNGTFAADTDWTKGTGWTIAAGKADCDGSQVAVTEIRQDIAGMVDGDIYRLTYTVSGYSAGTITPFLTNSASSAGTVRSENGTFIEDITIVNSAGDRFVFQGDVDFVGKIDDVICIKLGCVAEWRLKHENTFSPFEFEKARFLPKREPITPNQIMGKAGGGQTVIDDLGPAEEQYPHRILRVTSAQDTNFRGFFQDSVVNYSEFTFTYVDEDAAETTVRLWPVGSFPNPVQGAGGLFNLDLNVRKEIT